MNGNALLFSLAVLFAPATVMATESNDVKVMYLQPDGSLSALEMNSLDKVRWLRGSIALAKERLARELPQALGAKTAEIQLVSVPHPNSSKKANSMFVEWKHERSAVAFVPLVRAAGTEKLDVLLAFEVRVATSGQEPRVYPAIASGQKEFTAGFLSVSNRFDALEDVVKPLFDEAISKVITSAGAGSTASIVAPAHETPAKPQEARPQE